MFRYYLHETPNFLREKPYTINVYPYVCTSLYLHPHDLMVGIQGSIADVHS